MPEKGAAENAAHKRTFYQIKKGDPAYELKYTGSPEF
jgi:hypothetical protein